MPGVIDQLLADNRHHWGKDAQIKHVGWLARAPVAKRSAIVVEFTKPQHANQAIEMGTIWNSTMLNAELYDRSARVRQCFNCQQYGHVGSTCSNQERCGHCAGSHQTRDCTTESQGCRKCVNCGSAHASWSQACEYRQREVERIGQLALTRPRYHRVPAYTASSPGSPRATSPKRRPGELVDNAIPAILTTQTSSGVSSQSPAIQTPREEELEPQGPSSSRAQAPVGEMEDINMVDASGAVTPGTELTEVSGKAGRGIPRKATAIASQGSGLVDWTATPDTRGMFTFRTLFAGQSAAQNIVIRAGGPRRSERISSAALTMRSLATNSADESVLSANVRKRRPTTPLHD
jgi:hypothetical protein